MRKNKRKIPFQHRVKTHTREGKVVLAYSRGRGTKGLLVHKKRMYKKMIRKELRIPDVSVNTGAWRDFKISDKELSWRVKGTWKHFKIGETVKGIDAPTIKSATFEDHLEELLFDGKNYYRHAGGGRGFTWDERLMEIK